MPIVDIDRASPLDKIHTKRMKHAFAQVFVELIALEDERVNEVLRHKGITVWPGPVVGIEYGPGDKQILELALASANKEAKNAAKKPKKKAKR